MRLNALLARLDWMLCTMPVCHSNSAADEHLQEAQEDVEPPPGLDLSGWRAELNRELLLADESPKEVEKAIPPGLDLQPKEVEVAVEARNAEPPGPVEVPAAVEPLPRCV